MAVETERAPDLAVFTLEEVNQHKKENDAWIVHKGKVYDVTKFVDRHPGGKIVLLDHCGQDVTTVMIQQTPHRHSNFAYGWMSKFLIGKLHGAVSFACFYPLQLNLA